MSKTLREAAQQALEELDRGLQFGTVTRARSILRDALTAEDEAQPYAYAVYFPDQPTEELVHDLDDLCDDLTNREHEIRPLYTTPQPTEGEAKPVEWVEFVNNWMGEHDVVLSTAAYNELVSSAPQPTIPAGIKLAMQKIESAMCAHPNAVPTLMGEAYEALSSAMLAVAQQPAEREQPNQTANEYTYASKQATNCAVCGEYKHTPLRIDRMGGYVCLTCIDKQLEKREQTAQQPRGVWDEFDHSGMRYPEESDLIGGWGDCDQPSQFGSPELQAMIVQKAVEQPSQPQSEYPPLPEPDVHDAAGVRRAYSAAQMHAYLDADRARQRVTADMWKKLAESQQILLDIQQARKARAQRHAAELTDEQLMEFYPYTEDLTYERFIEACREVIAADRAARDKS